MRVLLTGSPDFTDEHEVDSTLGAIFTTSGGELVTVVTVAGDPVGGIAWRIAREHPDLGFEAEVYETLDEALRSGIDEGWWLGWYGEPRNPLRDLILQYAPCYGDLTSRD